MKIIPNLLAVAFLALASISCNHEAQSSGCRTHHLTGPYLGQTPPGDTPVLFAPGIVADLFREHGAAVFTPDGTELFWTRQVISVDRHSKRSRIVAAMHMEQKNGIWSRAKLAPFNAHMWTFISCITPDGSRLYFDSTREQDEGALTSRSWFVDKTDTGWSEPKPFTLLNKWNISPAKVQVAASGNVYFSSSYPKPALANASWGVGFFCAKYDDGVYRKPYMIDSSVNSADYLDYGFHVDPDEQFIIFSSGRPGGYSTLDLYISYRERNGSWGEAINLGEKINSHGADGSDWPFLSPDGRYLFFLTSMRPKDGVDYHREYTYDQLYESQLGFSNPHSKIFWVNTEFVEKLKPAHQKQAVLSD